jgi:cell division protein FtsZ
MPALTPPDAPEAASEGEPLELELEADGAETGSDGDGGGDNASSDELLLDASRLADEDAPVGAAAMPGRRRGLVSSSDETADNGSAGEAPAASIASTGAGDGEAASSEPTPRAPKAGGGATLFERMANLSRGGARADDAEDEDDDGPSISIPRFLGRQNNQ